MRSEPPRGEFIVMECSLKILALRLKKVNFSPWVPPTGTAPPERKKTLYQPFCLRLNRERQVFLRQSNCREMSPFPGEPLRLPAKTRYLIPGMTLELW